MSLALKIGVYVLFVGVYAGWIFLASKQVDRLTRGLVTGRWLIHSEVNIILRNLSIVLFIYLLSGYFSLGLTLLLLLVAQLGVLLAVVLLAFTGENLRLHTARTLWGGYEMRLRNPKLVSWVENLTGVVVLAYPIAAGYVFFTQPYPSPQLTLLIFRVTLVGIVFAGMPFVLMVTMHSLLSSQLDEETRILNFADQMSALTMNLIYIGLAFWAFGAKAPSTQITVDEIAIPLTSQLFVVLIVFFLLLVMLPYLIGTQRAKKWRLHLNQKRTAWLDKLLDILDFPTAARYPLKLEQLQGAIRDEIQTIYSEDQMVARGVHTERNPDSRQYLPGDIAEAYLQSRDLDPRLRYVDWLNKLLRHVAEVNADLQAREDSALREKTAALWAKAFRTRKGELQSKLVTLRAAKPGILVGAGVLLTPLLSLLLDTISQTLWGIFTKSLIE